MRARAKATQLALDHDCDAGAKGVGFLHAVGGEDGGAILDVLENDVPHESTR